MSKELKDIDYHVIENFISPEYAKQLSDYFIENQLQDPSRQSWGYISFGGNAEFFQSTEFKLEFDPLDKIREMIFFSYNFFLNQYDIEGDFTLNRSHANLMREGSNLFAHKDEPRTNHEDSSADIRNKTYVASFFLNDDYEGGELSLGKDSDIILKPKAGSLVLFPGYHTRHGVNKVKSGTRVNILSHFFDIKTGVEQ
jgi:hypothetical protein